jgi:heat shock protein HslJ
MLRLLPFIILLQACGPDETLTGYASADAVYVLQTLDGNNVAFRATLQLPEQGKISGTGPCNSFFAIQTAPYPWFDAGPIAATRKACPELTEEAAYFAALSEMTISETLGLVLILTNDTGREMAFQAK